jgi:hypothetical protein
MRDQTTATEGPVQGTPGIPIEPQKQIITRALEAQLPKLTAELKSKVSDVVGRKVAQRVLPVLLFVLMAIASAALAQTPPYAHGGTVGTTPVQAAAPDTLRKKIVFFNPNSTAIIAFCPAGPNRDTGQPLVCAVNGAGSLTLQPGNGFVFSGSNNVERLTMSAGWNVVANAGGSSWTIWDLE